MIEVIHQDSSEQVFDYDPNGNRIESVDEAGRMSAAEHDGLSRTVVQVIAPGDLDLVTLIHYDRNAGNIGTSSTVTSSSGQVVTTHTDGLGRTILVEGDTTKTVYNYDEIVSAGPDAGLLTTAVQLDPDNLNITSISLSDGAGRTIKSIDALGKVTAYTYDDNGNVLSVTDPDGKITANVYDERNRLSSSTADVGGVAAVTTYQYDEAGNLVQITDPEGKVSRFVYDDAGRKVSTTYAFGTADARTWLVEYWPAGQVKKLTKPDGVIIEYDYNDRDWLATREYTSGMASLGTDTFSYHPNGLLASAHGGLYNTDVDRSSLMDDYDGANRLLEERLDIGDGDKTVAYQYTADSLIAQITYPGGTVMGRTYNSRRQLHEVKLGGVTQATHSYDTANRRTSRTYANDTQTTWGYDLNSRTTTLSHATSGMAPTVFQAWDYRYTDAGNPLVQDDVTPSLSVHGEAYQYDGLHRLIDFKRGSVAGNTVPTPTSYQDWTLSKLGNWNVWDNNGTNETRTHNNINALTARSTVANPLTYDTNFNLIDDGEKYTYEYDANDKLKIVRDRTTTAVVAEYRYDALGRRVEKEVGSDVTRYYHSGEQIIEERDGSDAVTATYTYGDYVDEPLTMDRDSERYYYHTNRLYSVYALTDSSGDVAERYSYTPYGVTTTYDDAYANPQTSSRVDNPYAYTGQELDPETLTFYYNARTYHPLLGRFNQLDPIGFAGGDLNLYAYVGNQPLVFTDPSGLDKHHWFPQGDRYVDLLRKSKCGPLIEFFSKMHNFKGKDPVTAFAHSFTTDIPGKFKHGTPHHAVHYPSPNDSYMKNIEDIYKKSPSCCELLKSMKKLIEKSWARITFPCDAQGPLNVGQFRTDQRFPIMRHYIDGSDATGMLEEFIELVCSPPRGPRNPHPHPIPVPVPVPVRPHVPVPVHPLPPVIPPPISAPRPNPPIPGPIHGPKAPPPAWWELIPRLIPSFPIFIMPDFMLDPIDPNDTRPRFA